MRRIALQALIASIAASALVGMYVLLLGGGGDLEGKILVTALATSVLSILVMACGAALERGHLGFVPHGGTAASLGAYILMMIVIWKLSGRHGIAEGALGLAVVGAAAALACLLSLAALAPRFRWVRVSGYASAAAVALMLNLFIWHVLEPEEGLPVRLTGVLAILLAAVTITVPILHRLSERPVPAPAVPVRHCVACGERLAGMAGTEIECPACGARFLVQGLTKL